MTHKSTIAELYQNSGSHIADLLIAHLYNNGWCLTWEAWFVQRSGGVTLLMRKGESHPIVTASWFFGTDYTAYSILDASGELAIMNLGMVHLDVEESCNFAIFGQVLENCADIQPFSAVTYVKETSMLSVYESTKDEGVKSYLATLMAGVFPRCMGDICTAVGSQDGTTITLALEKGEVVAFIPTDRAQSMYCWITSPDRSLRRPRVYIPRTKIVEGVMDFFKDCKGIFTYD